MVTPDLGGEVAVMVVVSKVVVTTAAWLSSQHGVDKAVTVVVWRNIYLYFDILICEDYLPCIQLYHLSHPIDHAGQLFSWYTILWTKYKCLIKHKTSYWWRCISSATCCHYTSVASSCNCCSGTATIGSGSSSSEWYIVMLIHTLLVAVSTYNYANQPCWQLYHSSAGGAAAAPAEQHGGGWVWPNVVAKYYEMEYRWILTNQWSKHSSCYTVNHGNSANSTDSSSRSCHDTQYWTCDGNGSSGGGGR